MRIALLVSSMGGGGAERVAATLASAWARMGRDVTLVPTYMESSPMAYEAGKGVAVAPLEQFVSDRAVRISGRMPAKLGALRKLVAAISPDVIISFLTNVNIVAIVALAGIDKPLVISERSDITASVEMPRLLGLARRLLYQFADALVVQTERGASRYRQHIFRIPQTSVIPNPLPQDLHEYRGRVSQQGAGGEIVALGRLVAAKRFDQLIAAFAQAFREDPAWRLTIWGEGPLRDELKGVIDALHMQERVRLPGATVAPWDCLCSAQIFALSSAYEGFPNAMLEAMALGLPCVAYDCPTGPADLADGGTAAVLVPPGDITSLAEALRALAEQPDRRVQLGQVAAESVRKRFSEEAVLSRWDALFAELQVKL